MKKLTLLIAVFVAIIFTCKAQVATEEWYSIMDNDSSNHWSLIFEKDSEGVITTTGSWVYVYVPSATTASDSNASGSVTIAGTSCGFTIGGDASETAHSSTSSYSFSTTGIANNGTASGTYIMKFTDENWPDSIQGTFTATRISGSGITAEVSGVNNIKIDKQIVIYPNPATDAFQVIGIEGTTTITVLDLNGRLLFTKEVTDGETVTVSTLPNGVYMVSIKSKDFKGNQRLIIQR